MRSSFLGKSHTAPTLIATGKPISISLVKSIDIRSGEFARGHVFGKEDVEFVKGATLCLGKTKVSPDEDDPSTGAPDEAGTRMEKLV